MDSKTANVLPADQAAIAAASAHLAAASLNVQAPEFQPPATVSHMAVKLPDFWLVDPELWFTQADSLFRCANIKCSLTKYDYCLQKLPCEVLQSVHELARRVCTGVVDDLQLEEKLTASYQKSPWQRTFELLDMPDPGDRQPSVLMDAMLALLPEDVEPKRLFLALFLRRLPGDMRDHLAAQDLKTPDAMAAAANRLFDARPQGVAVAAVAAQRQYRDSSPAGRRRSPSRREGHQDKRRATPGRGGDSGALCFYHDRFGKRAAKCEPPCAWSGNGQATDGYSN
jgi:hypothetical protein